MKPPGFILEVKESSAATLSSRTEITLKGGEKKSQLTFMQRLNKAQ